MRNRRFSGAHPHDGGGLRVGQDARVTAEIEAEAFVAGGCASLNARPVADADLSKSRNFHVQKNPKDNHGIDIMLRDELRRWGRRATNGPEGSVPAGARMLVAYSDSWYWGLHMYLLELEVEFRDPETAEVVASAVDRRECHRICPGLHPRMRSC